ncbi:MAG: immunity 22 family protein [Lachnospiraceae bacterium]|jgi:hypothetical protein|nr:immunity 22 family protein [Lachnospiraceae bacterium]HBV84429.1 hypothetical protein [Lachnospiraceae bacterium]
MKKVKQKEYDFRNNLYLSVFVGVCQSKEILEQYLQQYLTLLEMDCIGSQFGIDFHINYYDDEYYTAIVNTQRSNDIDEIFADAAVFDLNLLKKDYPNHFDRQYNTVIIIGRMKYEGEVLEIQNDEFGSFRFLGTYPEPLPNKIEDHAKMYQYAINKLVDWGYNISLTNENGWDEKDYFKWNAEKEGKIFTALDPLRLLGIVTIVREYGDAWDRVEMPHALSIKPTEKNNIVECIDKRDNNK